VVADGEKPAFTRFDIELEPGLVYLLGSDPTTDDPAVRCVTVGGFGRPEGLSRIHVALHVAGSTVEVRDHSSFGTFRKHTRVSEPLTLRVPATLNLAGVVALRVEPPTADLASPDRTVSPHRQVISGPVRRHVVAALAADHIVVPEWRGAYVLTDDELAVIFRFSSENAKEHLQRARAQIEQSLGRSEENPRSREELIDWVKRRREITEIDVAQMNAYLVAGTGRGYEAALDEVVTRRRARTRRPS
jgi:hypothetical protein